MRRVELLDYGRFFAALSVIAFHYTSHGIYSGKITSITATPIIVEFSRYGYMGVELFFMISGYVIFYSAKNRNASQFATSRALRLYPSYWFGVLFTSIIVLFWAPELSTVSFKNILANLTMFQYQMGIEDIDGVYWTLAYELLFYSSVLLLLMAGLQKHLEKIITTWPFLMCVAIVLKIDYLPLMGGFFYFFAAGSLFAIVKEKPNLLNKISLAIAYLLCLRFGVEDTFSQSDFVDVELSGWVAGTIVTFLFLFFYMQNTTIGQNLSLPFSRILGALTYPVYLIHANFGYVIINNFADDQNKFWVLAFTLILVLVISFMMHKIIEVKLGWFWKKLFTASVGRIVGEVQMLPERLFPTKKASAGNLNQN